jgi:hypothetical protein
MSKALGIRASTLYRWENYPPSAYTEETRILISDFVHNCVDHGYLEVK